MTLKKILRIARAVNTGFSGTESPTPSGERAAAVELIATRITADSGTVASLLAAGMLYLGEGA